MGAHRSTLPGYMDAAPADELVGRTLGDSYLIVRLLDEGGMGRVYEAEHVRLHRRVAVKVLPSAVVAQALYRERFYAEAEIISKLNHPHIVSVIDFDITEEGAPYLVMELLEGETLAQRMLREQTLSLSEVTRLVLDIASGLAAAHHAAIVHRDLKPENVFLVALADEEPFVKLLDFGISKRLKPGRRLTGYRELLGTPAYMAPEQAACMNDDIDGRTDEYALASIAFEMLAGHPPFDGQSLAELIQQVVYEPPPRLCDLRPDLPEAIDHVVSKGLSKRREDRYRDVNELALAFAVAAGPTSDDPRPRSDIRLRKGSPDDEDQGMFALIAAVEQARRAADLEAWKAATGHVDRALRIADAADDPTVRAMLRISEPLIHKILLERLGGMGAALRLERLPNADDITMSPPVVYLASRFRGGATVAEALDLTTMSVSRTLAALVRLLDVEVLARTA